MPRSRSSAKVSVWVVPLVDAADVVDDAGEIEEAFGEGSLTSVYVRQDAEIEGSHGASCFPSRF